MSDLFGISLQEAIEATQRHKDEGDFVHCPCCDQGVKVYPRKITGTMLRQLAQMSFSNMPLAPAKIKGSHGGDHAKLAYWGLAKQQADFTWTNTTSGSEFLYDRLRVPEIAYVYNGEVIRFSENNVGVRDRIGTKFSYDELMNGGVWY